MSDEDLLIYDDEDDWKFEDEDVSYLSYIFMFDMFC